MSVAEERGPVRGLGCDRPPLGLPSWGLHWLERVAESVMGDHVTKVVAPAYLSVR